MRIRCPNPACAQTLSVPEECAGKTARCSVCKQVFTVGAVPLDRVPPPLPVAAPPPVGPRRAAPQPQPPPECPVCKHRLPRRAPKCVYCGANVAVPADQQQAVGTDLAGGVSVQLLAESGREILSGRLSAHNDGLRVAGYPPRSAGAPTGEDAAPTREDMLALALGALSVISVLAGGSGMFVGGGGGKGKDGPEMVTIEIAWGDIHLIERLPDHMRLTVSTEKRRSLGGTKVKTEVLGIVLTSTPGGAERCYGLLYEQILKYMGDPSALPHCPGCGRVVKSDANHCAYCGANW